MERRMRRLGNEGQASESLLTGNLRKITFSDYFQCLSETTTHIDTTLKIQQKETKQTDSGHTKPRIHVGSEVTIIDSARDVNGLNLRFLFLRFGNSDSEHSVLHRSLHLTHLRILWQPEPPHELPAATLQSVPLVVLVLLLHLPLSTNLEHPIVLDLHFHFLLLDPGKIGLEHVGFRGFPPIDPGVDEGGIFPGSRGKEGRGRERGVLEGVPEVEREGVEGVPASAAEPARNERHRLSERVGVLKLASEDVEG
ncbi:hypothetical protein BT93_J1443 [Corymbia citriodora subsp. variegata]|nr:hypothetical protein BT93_J1443 [Corymbia citriodora subsp. variegata]